MMAAPPTSPERADIVERIKSRLNDAPMPTERLLDECATEIDRLRSILRAAHESTDPHFILSQAMREGR